MTALLAGAIDATYIGPNPSVNAFQQSHGAVRVVAGAASGGAYLVVKPNIDSAADLKGKKVASPQLGNTQDIALRSWLKQHGLKTDANGGGDVSVIPQDNATTLDTFRQGAIAGAWVPEPWATRLVDEGGGKILVDERTLWPQGQYVTTDLLVSTSFLKAHPDVVKRLLEGQDETPATGWRDLVTCLFAEARGDWENVLGMAQMVSAVGRRHAVSDLEALGLSIQNLRYVGGSEMIFSARVPRAASHAVAAG